ncbi:MAG: IPT/TIG domain-containing protein [Acidobacteriota bacterium]
MENRVWGSSAGLCMAILGLALAGLVACAPPPPTVSGVEPAGGPSGGGTEVTLSGDGFKVGLVVTVGGREAEIKGLGPDGQSLTFIAPGGPVGDQPVIASHGADGDPSEAVNFTYQPVRIVGTTPGGGATIPWAERPESVELTFDQALDVSAATIAVRPPAVEGEEEDEEPLDGVANYDKDASKLTFTATKKVGEGEHSVLIAGLKDLAGNEVSPVSFNFTVGPRPVERMRTASRGGRSGPSRSGGSSGSGGRTYDDGTLETSYFGGDLRFVDTRRVDYLWVKDGFSFEGRKFHFRPWADPEFIGEDAEDRDAEDFRLARQMTPEIPQAFVDILTHTWRGRAEASTRSGDIKVTGRIVDCSTGNVTAKVLVGFGAGAGYTTFDMKFTDARTGQLVAALHHRVVSGTAWSTTDSKLVKWMERFGEQIAKRDFGGLYERGKVADD